VLTSPGARGDAAFADTLVIGMSKVSDPGREERRRRSPATRRGVECESLLLLPLLPRFDNGHLSFLL
jgi:hypothetical protein